MAPAVPAPGAGASLLWHLNTGAVKATATATAIAAGLGMPLPSIVVTAALPGMSAADTDISIFLTPPTWPLTST
jgi:hypothetical protein